MNKRIAALSAAMLLLLCACGARSGPAEPDIAATQETLPAESIRHEVNLLSPEDRLSLLVEYYRQDDIAAFDASENEAFLSFTKNLFVDTVSGDTISLHYTLADPEAYGITGITPSFSSVYNMDTAAQDKADYQETLDYLHGFDYTLLTPENRLTYDILEDYLETAVEMTAYRNFDEYLSPIMGVQADLPISLAEYSFRNLSDVDTYDALLKEVSPYLDSVILHEEKRLEVCLCMPESSIREVIAACNDFLRAGEDNVLLTSYEERLQELPLSDSEKNARIKANRKVVEDEILPAYSRLITCLRNMLNYANTAVPLCEIPGGTDYYKLLLRSNVGTTKSPEELITLIDQEISGQMEELLALLKEDPDLLNKLDFLEQDTRTPSQLLALLEEKMTDYFPALPVTVSCTVKYVPESIEAFSSPAFYLVSPLDGPEEQTIYINASETNKNQFFTTLAHEGFPGHLYQNVFASLSSSDPIRRVINYSGCNEGWGLYVEHLAYDWDPLVTDTDPKLAALMKLDSSVSLGVYARLDLGIHYQGWKKEKAAEFLSDYFGEQTAESVSEYYDLLLSEPAYYLKYYVGQLEISLLTQKAQELLGAAYDPVEFHRFYLELGSCPFSVAEEYMKAWAEVYLSQSVTP